MRRISTIATAASLISFANAQLALDVFKTRRDTGLSALPKRALGSADLSYDTIWSSYYTQIMIGTPGQFLTAFLSTRPASLFMIPSADSQSCKDTDSENLGACTLGGFDSNLSTTFTSLDETFSFNWGTPSTSTTGTAAMAEGNLFTDQVKIGDLTVNMTMGLAEQVSNELAPFFGLGKPHSDDDHAQDKYLLAGLVSQGVIPTLAFSLWLDTQVNRDGKLLLGAIDASKYEGTLTSFPLYNNGNTLCMSFLSATSPSGTTELISDITLPMNHTLGGTSIFLPQDIAYQTWAVVGVERMSPYGRRPLVRCSMRNSTGYFTFGIGQGDAAVKVDVRMGDLVLLPGSQDHGYTDDGEKLCLFGIENSTDSAVWGLSEPFFQSTYVVLDLHNERVGLAPVKADVQADEERVIPFSGNGAPIPSATVAASQPASLEIPIFTPSFTAWEQAQSLHSMWAKETSSPAATLPDETPDSTRGGGLSTGAKAGIGVGSTVGFLIIAAISFMLYRRRHLKRSSWPAIRANTSMADLTGESYRGRPPGTQETNGDHCAEKYGTEIWEKDGKELTETGGSSEKGEGSERSDSSLMTERREGTQATSDTGGGIALTEKDGNTLYEMDATRAAELPAPWPEKYRKCDFDVGW
ncbi:aspartic peptidase domain-containing protein [Xylariomycetidae sp. FL2044]|nr:aspartic peptidase domain-containing protein [Xylariomycetidae sp. FL2044]